MALCVWAFSGFRSKHKNKGLRPAAWESFCKEYGNLMPCKAFLVTFERLPRAKTPAAAVAIIAVP